MHSGGVGGGPVRVTWFRGTAGTGTSSDPCSDLSVRWPQTEMGSCKRYLGARRSFYGHLPFRIPICGPNWSLGRQNYQPVLPAARGYREIKGTRYPATDALMLLEGEAGGAGRHSIFVYIND